MSMHGWRLAHVVGARSTCSHTQGRAAGRAQLPVPCRTVHCDVLAAFRATRGAGDITRAPNFEQTRTQPRAGFPKGDYDRTPGRKGRVIRDDPSKYPSKEDMGFFLGAVGGWAGERAPAPSPARTSC